MSDYVIKQTLRQHLKTQDLSSFDSLTILNCSRYPIYVLDAGGRTRELLPGTASDNSTYWHVKIERIERTGRRNVSDMDNVLRIDMSGKDIFYPTDEVMIKWDRLERGPVYVAELGLAIATEPDKDKLEIVHPTGKHSIENAITHAHSQAVANHEQTWFLGTAVSKEKGIDEYYVVVNNLICTIKVDYAPYATDESTGVFLELGLGEKRRMQYHNPDIKPVDEINLDGVAWLMGYDRVGIERKLRELEQTRKKFVSPDEAELRIQKAVEDTRDKMNLLEKEKETLKEKNDQLQREIELLKKKNQLDDLTVETAVSNTEQKNKQLETELTLAKKAAALKMEEVKLDELSQENKRLETENQLLKNDLQNSKNELRQALEPSAQSTEQFLSTVRAEQAQLQYQTLMAKHQLEQERAESRHQREMEKLREEQRYDREVNEHKLRREQYSTAATESSSIASIVKAAAVIVPIVVSAGLWLHAKSAVASIGCIINGIRAMAPAIGRMGARLLQATDGMLRISRAMANGVCSIASKVGSGIKAIGTTAVNVVSKCASGAKYILTRAGSFLCDSLSSAWSWATS